MLLQTPLSWQQTTCLSALSNCISKQLTSNERFAVSSSFPLANVVARTLFSQWTNLKETSYEVSKAKAWKPWCLEFLLGFTYQWFLCSWKYLKAACQHRKRSSIKQVMFVQFNKQKYLPHIPVTICIFFKLSGDGRQEVRNGRIVQWNEAMFY